MVFSLFLVQNLPLHRSSRSDKAPMSPKRILNVELSYLNKVYRILFNRF